MVYALRYIYGLGLTSSRQIVETLKIDPAKHAEDLTGDELAQITGMLQEKYILRRSAPKLHRISGV